MFNLPFPRNILEEKSRSPENDRCWQPKPREIEGLSQSTRGEGTSCRTAVVHNKFFDPSPPILLSLRVALYIPLSPPERPYTHISRNTLQLATHAPARCELSNSNDDRTPTTYDDARGTHVREAPWWGPDWPNRCAFVVRRVESRSHDWWHALPSSRR